SPYGHRAYVTNQNAWPNTISVIDTANDSLIATWDINGEGVHGLDISPDGRTLYATENERGKTYAVDTSTGQIIATISTGYNSWEAKVFPAAAGPVAYVTSAGSGNVTVIDTHTNTAIASIALSGGPRGLALFPPSTICPHDALLSPPSETKGGAPDSTVLHGKTLLNLTGATDSFAITLSGSTWPA
ncbi:MAG: hypothetical protein GY842_21555, partial [bacterium]|nr:hypothetical protein [bacterium]